MIPCGCWDGDGVTVQSFNNHSYNDCWDDDDNEAEGRRRRSERAGEGMRLRETNGDGARGNESERRSERE